MAEWWDQLTTGLGNVVLAPQMGGMPMPTDPAQRQAMIASGLLSLGGTVSQAAQARMNPMAALGAGFQNLQTQGANRQQNQLQNMLLAGKIGEMKKKNETREALKKMAPPEGYTAETWGALVEGLDAKDLLGVYQDSIKRQQDREEIAGMGPVPGFGPASAPGGNAPSVSLAGPRLRAG